MASPSRSSDDLVAAIASALDKCFSKWEAKLEKTASADDAGFAAFSAAPSSRLDDNRPTTASDTQFHFDSVPDVPIYHDVDAQRHLAALLDAQLHPAVDVEPSDTNSSAPTTCSTKFPLGVVDAVTAAGAYALPEEIVYVSACATATPTTTTFVTSGTPTKCSTMVLGVDTGSGDVTGVSLFVEDMPTAVPVPLMVSEFFPSQLSSDIKVGLPSPTMCSVVCLNLNPIIKVTASALGTALTFYPETLPYVALVLWKDVSFMSGHASWVWKSPWPLYPRQLHLILIESMVSSSYGNMEFSWLWKPPWPSLTQKHISCQMDVVNYHGYMLLKKPWPLHVLLDNIHEGVVLRPMPWPAFCCNKAKKKSKLLLLIAWREFVQGTTVGTFGEDMMHTIDTPKTSLQSQAIMSGTQAQMDIFQMIMALWLFAGLTGCYGGISPGVAGSLATGATHVGFIQSTKSWLENANPNLRGHYSHFIAGAIGDTLGSFIYFSCEVMNPRMRIQGTRKNWQLSAATGSNSQQSVAYQIMQQKCCDELWDPGGVLVVWWDNKLFRLMTVKDSVTWSAMIGGVMHGADWNESFTGDRLQFGLAAEEAISEGSCGVVLSIPPWPPPKCKMVELQIYVHHLHHWSVRMFTVLCFCWEFSECKKH